MSFSFCFEAVGTIKEGKKFPSEKKLVPEGGNNKPPAFHFLLNVTKVIEIKPSRP